MIRSALVVSLSAATACSAGGADDGGKLGPASGNGGAASTGATGATGATTSIDLGLAGTSTGGGPIDKPPAVIETVLPAGFTAELNGGWRVLGSLATFTEPTSNTCANVLRIVARDFTQAHIDFGQQKPASWANPGLYMGHVFDAIGEDRKPHVNGTRSPLDVIEGFDDWYTNSDGVNVPYVMDLWLQPDPAKQGYFVFDSNSFFPLDAHNTSPGDVQTGGNDNGPHNFLFTTELHTSFEYKGREVFNFRGDDDVFVFIDGKLAVDIGGIHGPLPGNVDLDAQAAELGIEIGQVYTLDLFQAERNPGGSNFRIETSLDFKECGILPADVK